LKRYYCATHFVLEPQFKFAANFGVNASLCGLSAFTILLAFPLIDVPATPTPTINQQGDNITITTATVMPNGSTSLLPKEFTEDDDDSMLSSGYYSSSLLSSV